MYTMMVMEDCILILRDSGEVVFEFAKSDFAFALETFTNLHPPTE